MPTKKKKTTKTPAARKTRRKTVPRNWVAVSNSSYGKALRGTKIYWEGVRPTSLRDDGSIKFGKNILEILGAKFPRFRWILTAETTSITTRQGIVRVRTSKRLLNSMGSELIDRTRDIKNDIIRKFFAIHFTDEFTEQATQVYVPGTLSKTLHHDIIPRLTARDKEALDAFLPDYLSGESPAVVQKLKAKAQIESLKALAANLELELSREHSESWWQEYIKGNIVLMQQGYIKAIEKLNTAIGNTKFPDFLLVTHDSYLDVMEIKKPTTNILKPDASRGNYYFDPEFSKAIIQTENYIHNVYRFQDQLRSFLKDNHGIEIRAVRPRGIILAGDGRTLSSIKEQDDFRLLSQGIKNITIVTYDELLTRLENYISVLEALSKDTRANATSQKKAAKIKARG